MKRHLIGALPARPTAIGMRTHAVGVICIAVLVLSGISDSREAIFSQRASADEISETEPTTVASPRGEDPERLLAQRTIKQTSRAYADPLEQSADPLNNADWSVDEFTGEAPAEFSPTAAESSQFRSIRKERGSQDPLPLSRPSSGVARNLSLNGALGGEDSAAAEEAKSSRRIVDKSRSSIPWGTTIFSLLIITGLIVLCAWIVKKIQPLKVQGLSTDVVEVLGKRPLDPRQQIYLIRCGSRILVVGSSLQGMSTLAEITDPEEMDMLIGLCRKPTHDSRIVQSFQTLLGKSNWWQSARTSDKPLPQSGDASITRGT